MKYVWRLIFIGIVLAPVANADTAAHIRSKNPQKTEKELKHPKESPDMKVELLARRKCEARKAVACR